MNYTKIYIILACVFLSITSCKKKEIEIAESNEPVFSVSGTLDNTAFNVIAGDEGAYMHTMVKRENGVNIFSGVITSNDLSFEFGVFDGNLDVEMSGVPSTNIAPIFSSVSTTPITTLSKNIFANESSINYIKWFIDDVDRGMNDVPIYESGKYNICAEIHFNDGSYKTLCNELILGFNHNAKSTMSSELLGNGLVKFSVGSSSNIISSTEWFLDDVFIEERDSIELMMSSSLQKVTAKIHFENGTVKTKSTLVNGYDIQKNIEDFSAFELQSENVTPSDFNLRVIVNDLNEIYRSDLSNNVSSKVYISDVSYYGVNDAGKNVYKITGTINCKERKVGTTADVNLDVNFVFGIEIP